MAPVDGFWGQPTSTLDWCESNYDVNSYIAEFCKSDRRASLPPPPPPLSEDIGTGCRRCDALAGVEFH